MFNQRNLFENVPTSPLNYAVVRLIYNTLFYCGGMAHSSETKVHLYQTKQRHNLEHGILHRKRLKNPSFYGLKSLKKRIRIELLSPPFFT